MVCKLWWDTPYIQCQTALVSMLSEEALVFKYLLRWCSPACMSMVQECTSGLQRPMQGPLSTPLSAYHESQVHLQVLEELASLHEVPRLMQDFRSAGKFLSDFVEPLCRRARCLSPGTPGTVRPLL